MAGMHPKALQGAQGSLGDTPPSPQPLPLPRQLSFLAATLYGQVCKAHASAFRETQLRLLLRENGPLPSPPLQGQGWPL